MPSTYECMRLTCRDRRGPVMLYCYSDDDHYYLRDIDKGVDFPVLSDGETFHLLDPT